jgi:hypothetical protein
MPLFGQQVVDRFLAAWSSLTDIVVGNTATEASIMGSASVVGSRMVPANWLQPGRTIRIILNGLYNAPTLPGTLTINVKIGGVTVATGTATSILSLAGNKGCQISTTFTCRQAGSSGTIAAAGTFQYGIAGQARQFVDISPVADATVDTTQPQQLDVTAKWSTADSAQILTIRTGTVEFLAP